MNEAPVDQGKATWLAYAILYGTTALVFLLFSDFFLRWYLKIPPRFLDRMVYHAPDLVPSKRVAPNLDITATGPFREFTFHVSSTPEGFRRTAPFELNDKVQNPEIIFLGDSQTFGIGVNDGETIASYFSLETGKTVLNAGCSGYNNIEEYLLGKTLLETRAPKEVFLLFFPANDPYENYVNRKKLEGVFEPRKPPKRSLSLGEIKAKLNETSALYYLAVRLREILPINELLGKIGVVNKGLPGELIVFQIGENEQKREYWKVTEEAIRRLKAETDAKSVILTLILIPEKFQIDDKHWKRWIEKYHMNPETFDRMEPNNHLREFAESNNIPFLDLVPVFRKEWEKGKKLYWKFDHHLAQEGNRIAAKQLANWINRRF